MKKRSQFYKVSALGLMVVILWGMLSTIDRTSQLLACEMTSSKAQIVLEGKEINAQTYKINGNDYINLCDLDYVMKSSLVPLNVVWDSKNQQLMIDRVKVDVPAEEKTTFSLGDLAQVVLPTIAEPTCPKTQTEFEQMFLHMMATKQYTYTFRYDKEMFDRLEDGSLEKMIVDAFEVVFDKYPEHFCYRNHVSLELNGYATGGNMTLILDSTYLTEEEATAMYEAFFGKAQQVILDLVAQGKLTKEMSQKEMARVLYEWVGLWLEYDTKYAGASYTGYGALENKTAVCQGYTALYNTLCKLVGIDIWGVSGIVNGGEDHLWSEAILDGQKVYIDTTFGDPMPDQKGKVDFKYFMIEEKELRKNHIW